MELGRAELERVGSISHLDSHRGRFPDIGCDGGKPAGADCAVCLRSPARAPSAAGSGTQRNPRRLEQHESFALVELFQFFTLEWLEEGRLAGERSAPPSTVLANCQVRFRSESASHWGKRPVAAHPDWAVAATAAGVAVPAKAARAS